MTSIAERVAVEVVEKGGNISKIAQKYGASKNYSENGNIQKTKTFQAIVARFREQTAKQLEKKVKLSLKHLNDEKFAKSSARDLMNIADTGIKNVQLLTGGATEHVQVVTGMRIVHETDDVDQHVPEQVTQHVQERVKEEVQDNQGVSGNGSTEP